MVRAERVSPQAHVRPLKAQAPRQSPEEARNLIENSHFVNQSYSKPVRKSEKKTGPALKAALKGPQPASGAPSVAALASRSACT